MSTWFKLLPLDLGEITDYLEPDNEVSPNENLVGEMDDDQKKLYTKWTSLKAEAIHCRADVITKRGDPLEQAKAQALELQTKTDLIKELFWISIRDGFQLWGKDAIGVRKGFIIVWYESSGHPPFGELFRGLIT